MWNGVRACGVRIKTNEGEEGGKRREVGATDSVGRVAWICRSVLVHELKDWTYL
jgi:hypothetical protein